MDSVTIVVLVMTGLAVAGIAFAAIKSRGPGSSTGTPAPPEPRENSSRRPAGAVRSK